MTIFIYFSFATVSWFYIIQIYERILSSSQIYSPYILLQATLWWVFLPLIRGKLKEKKANCTWTFTKYESNTRPVLKKTYRCSRDFLIWGFSGFCLHYPPFHFQSDSHMIISFWGKNTYFHLRDKVVFHKNVSIHTCIAFDFTMNL